MLLSKDFEKPGAGSKKHELYIYMKYTSPNRTIVTAIREQRLDCKPL
jgi:hypothetical protein